MISKSSSVSSYDVAFARFMKTVFNYMAGGVALSGLMAYITLNTALLAVVMNPAFQILFLVAWFGFGFFAHKIVEKSSPAVGLGLFIGFSALTGMALAPIVLSYTAASVTTAFFVSAAIFALTSMFGISTKKSLAGWGGFIRMSLWGLFAAILINMVLGMFGVATTGLSLFISFLVVPIVSAGVAYEVNMLRDNFHHFGGEAVSTSKIAIMSAVSLYTSFVVLFLHILNILGILGGND